LPAMRGQLSHGRRAVLDAVRKDDVVPPGVGQGMDKETFNRRIDVGTLPVRKRRWRRMAIRQAQ